MPSRFRLIGPTCAAVALLVYLLTLSPGPHPGRSAIDLMGHLDLQPIGSTASPLWHQFALAADGVARSNVSRVLNVFSALCGAAAVGLLGALLGQTLWWLGGAAARRPAGSPAIVACGAVAGAAALAFCSPFWTAATRAGPATLDTLLLLLAAHLLLGPVRRGRAAGSIALAIVYGVGVAECATFLILAPIFGLAAAYLLWRADALQMRVVGPAIALGLCAALALYGLRAWQFTGGAAFELLGYTSFWEALRVTWRDQFNLIMHSLPRVGWLLIVLLTIVPFGIATLVAQRALGGEREWTLFILHLVLTGVVASVVFDAPFAPWALLGEGQLLVTPYLLNAILAGYLATYWILCPLQWIGGGEAALARSARVLAAVAAAAVVGTTVALPVVHASAARARQAHGLHALVRATVDVAHDCAWLVTDGSLDPSLVVAAHEAGSPLRVLNLGGSGQELYMRYAARVVGRPDIAGLASVGMPTMLQEWLRVDPDLSRSLAVMPAPDLWYAVGEEPLPDRAVHRAASATGPVDPEAAWRVHTAFWDRVVAPLRADARQGGGAGRLAAHHLRELSRVANDLGVYVQQAGSTGVAVRCYARAREIAPDNLSALLNLFALHETGTQVPDPEGLSAAVAVLRDGEQKPHLWALARAYGYLANAEAFLQLGWQWALSGAPRGAAQAMRRVVGEEGDLDRLQGGFAALHLSRAELEESRALYRQMLDRDAQNREALLGMARIAARTEGYADATNWLARARQAGVPETQTQLEVAALDIRAGELAAARVKLEAIVAQPSAPSAAWALLAEIFHRQSDAAGVARCLRVLRELPADDPAVAIALARHALARRDLGEARRFLDTALRLRPQAIPVLIDLVRIDISEARPDMARQHVTHLLRLDPDHDFGNWVLGSLQVRDGDLALAESSYRRSLRRQRAPEVLNDLASILSDLRRYDEAEPLVLEALEREPRLHVAWSTLAELRARQDRSEEALDAYRKALALAPQDVGLRLRFAEYCLEAGQPEAAAQLLAGLGSERGRLPASLERKRLKLEEQLLRRP